VLAVGADDVASQPASRTELAVRASRWSFSHDPPQQAPGTWSVHVFPFINDIGYLDLMIMNVAVSRSDSQHATIPANAGRLDTELFTGEPVPSAPDRGPSVAAARA
jgi:hypothetical protein